MFTTSGSTQTKIHRDEKWRVRVTWLEQASTWEFQTSPWSKAGASPIVEDFTYHLHVCKIFTKLDLRQGYHKIALDPSTRQVATFSTPWGELQTTTTGVRSKVVTSCLQRCHVQNLWGHTPLLKPKRWHTPGRKRPDKTYRSTEDCP